MDYVRFQHSLQAEGVRLAESAATGLDTPVPSCPGWTVADLVGHTGSVYRTATEQLRTGNRGDPAAAAAPRADLLAWYSEALAELRAELARRDPGDPADGGDGSADDVGFWYRRLAHEAAMHRTDVEMAVGVPRPIDVDLAVDGIDEALRVLLPIRYDAAGPDAAVGRTIGVHTHQQHWRLTLRRDNVEVSRSPGFTDAAVAGDPGDLLLYLWGRRPGTVVSRTGDLTVLGAFRRRLALSMV
ncbi:maleylpyruvate isomerase family mycothiol-dependent enzyme [Uniformispora flossi]|uniref:maleylpyruvate isomerase family mycothiol-dependent enzyme n=1 Tax=Uniformispora flossi TaxID=3390723 RepID=UPI003C2ED5E6